MKLNPQRDFIRNILLYRLTLVLGKNGLLTSSLYFFFTDIKNFSASQALFFISLVLTAVAITEVPTGVVADKVSRKLSVVIGYTIIFVSWIGILSFDQFWQICFLSVIRGIGGSFISGADDALLYDSLKEAKQTDKYKKIYNKSKSIELIAFAFTILLGGILAKVDLALPIIVNIVLTAISAIIASLFTEPSHSDKGEEIGSTGYIAHTIQSIKTVFSKNGLMSGLLVIFVSTALINAVFKSTKSIVGPLLDSIGFDVLEVSVVVTIIIIIKAIGAYIGSKFNKAGGEVKEIVVSLIICIVGILTVAFVPNVPIKLLVFVLVIGLDNIVLTNLSVLFNELIESKTRSTLLSLNSLFIRSSEMVYITTFGWVLDVWSHEIALVFTSIWLLVVLGVFSLLWLTSKSKVERVDLVEDCIS